MKKIGLITILFCATNLSCQKNNLMDNELLFEGEWMWERSEYSYVENQIWHDSIINFNQKNEFTLAVSKKKKLFLYKNDKLLEKYSFIVQNLEKKTSPTDQFLFNYIITVKNKFGYFSGHINKNEFVVISSDFPLPYRNTKTDFYINHFIKQ